MKAVGWQAAACDIAWKQIHFITQHQPTRRLTLVHKSGSQKHETGMRRLINRRASWYDAINQTSGREILSVSNQNPFIYLFLCACIKSDPWFFVLFCFPNDFQCPCVLKTVFFLLKWIRERESPLFVWTFQGLRVSVPLNQTVKSGLGTLKRC